MKKRREGRWRRRDRRTKNCGIHFMSREERNKKYVFEDTKI
jgi:hypothetical protein